MILFINTTDFKALTLALIDPGKHKPVRTFTRAVAFNENHKTLELLEKFLRTAKIVPRNLQKIVVCSGPGSFTGIRVGVALAQALGFALNIPVLAIKKTLIPSDLQKLDHVQSKVTHLNYGRRPNITKPKQ